MDQLNNSETFPLVNQNKEEDYLDTTKIPEKKTLFMSFVGSVYGFFFFLNSLFWFAGYVVLNSPDTLMLLYGILIDLIILQAIFATSPSVVRFKKVRLLLPILPIVLYIVITSPPLLFLFSKFFVL